MIQIRSTTLSLYDRYDERHLRITPHSLGACVDKPLNEPAAVRRGQD